MSLPRTTVDKQHLELVTEVRALALAVRNLHTVFVKRRVLYWLLGGLTALTLIAIGSLAVVVVAERNNTHFLVSKLVDSCKVRNQQVKGTDDFIVTIQRLQKDSYKHIPVEFKTPEQAKLQHRYDRALKKWRHSQPKPFACQDYQSLHH